MTIVIKIVVFIVGIYLSMRVIAAFYGIIDLWYTIKTAYPRVILNILVWSAITTSLVVLLGNYRRAFLWGLLTYVLIYLFSYIMFKLPLIRDVRSVDNR